MSSPYLPWLDCVGEIYNQGWSLLYDSLATAVSTSKAKNLAGVPAETFPGILSECGLLQDLPNGENFALLTSLHHEVLQGDLHPKYLGGHCHLGIVLLKYLVGRIRMESEQSLAWQSLTQAWQLLVRPGGNVSTFDALESSRWGAFLNRELIWRAAADLDEMGRSTSLPRQPILEVLQHHGLPSWRGSLFIPEQDPKSDFGVCSTAGLAFERWRLNFTAVALSTHAAVVEPATCLREALSVVDAQLFVRFLGVLHPGPTAPCQLLPKDTQCSQRGGWAGDAQGFLYELGDMRTQATEEVGFVEDLAQKVKLLHQRHIRGTADLVICAHPFLLCALLRPHTHTFMLVYLTPSPSTLVPEKHRLWVLSMLAELAEGHSTTSVLAASQVYSLLALYQAGARVPAVRPSAQYIAQRHQWKPQGKDSHRLFLWVTSGVVEEFLVSTMGFVKEGLRQGHTWLQGLDVTVKEKLASGFVTWEFLSEVRCVVLLPWDLQLTVFPELYALGVPLLLPSASYVASYGVRLLERYGMMFWSVNPRFEGRLPGLQIEDLTEQPWIATSVQTSASSLLAARERFLYWFEASDFATFGHTLRFDSVPEMLRLAATTPSSSWIEVSSGMREEWEAARRVSASTYAAVACRLLGWASSHKTLSEDGYG